jgi:hypothetical protein
MIINKFLGEINGHNIHEENVYYSTEYIDDEKGPLTKLETEYVAKYFEKQWDLDHPPSQAEMEWDFVNTKKTVNELTGLDVEIEEMFSGCRRTPEEVQSCIEKINDGELNEFQLLDILVDRNSKGYNGNFDYEEVFFKKHVDTLIDMGLDLSNIDYDSESQIINSKLLNYFVDSSIAHKCTDDDGIMKEHIAFLSTKFGKKAVAKHLENIDFADHQDLGHYVSCNINDNKNGLQPPAKYGIILDYKLNSDFVEELEQQRKAHYAEDDIENVEHFDKVLKHMKYPYHFNELTEYEFDIFENTILDLIEASDENEDERHGYLPKNQELKLYHLYKTNDLNSIHTQVNEDVVDVDEIVANHLDRTEVFDTKTEEELNKIIDQMNIEDEVKHNVIFKLFHGKTMEDEEVKILKKSVKIHIHNQSEESIESSKTTVKKKKKLKY